MYIRRVITLWWIRNVRLISFSFILLTDPSQSPELMWPLPHDIYLFYGKKKNKNLFSISCYLLRKSNNITANIYFEVFASNQLLLGCLNTPEYMSSFSVHWQLRSSQTINTNIFYLWKPPGAKRPLRSALFPVCTQEGFCHHRNVDHLFHSVLFIFIVLGDVSSFQSGYFFYSFFRELWDVTRLHSFIFHTTLSTEGVCAGAPYFCVWTWDGMWVLSL